MASRTVLCRYHYDPLDRLAVRTPYTSTPVNAFYRADRLVSETQGREHRSFVHADRQLLAVQAQQAGAFRATLTGTDRQQSVLNATGNGPLVHRAYTPYGHPETVKAMPGFLGVQPDAITGHYLLGNGYRAYNPVLMRFNGPDSLSPFGKGGINAYAYCAGDPINRSDPGGHDFWDTVIAATYIAAGIATALIGALVARSAIKAVVKGVEVEATASQVALNAPVLRRAANTSEKISAAVGLGAVAAGGTWGAGFVVKTVDPDSPAVLPLNAMAVALSVPTLALRSWGFARTELAKRAAKTAVRSVAPAQRSVSVQTGSVRSRASSVRGIDDIQKTHL